ncbi:MAG: ABC transporter ATP-binding protein [Clostridiaceae bacterium]
MANIIELKHINKIYGDKIKTQVLYDINLNIKENSFNSIIGQSGSGKSTILNIIGTLDKPTSGEIFIGGNPTDKMKKNELAYLRNQTIGFIFQFHYLLPEFTAYENVLIPYLMNNKKPSKEILERADEPTGNLDSDTTETIYKILRNVNEKFKTTFLIITHDRKIAEKADRIIEVKDGKINLDLNVI